MGKAKKPNISVKKSWKFATVQLVSLVAVIAGLLILPSVARAIDRLTDEETKQLLGSIETTRSNFEAALDQELKNSVIRGPRGEVNTNEYLDDLQDQVTRTRERFNSDYSASSEVIALLEYTTRLDRWTKSQPAGFKGSAEWEPFATDLRRLAAAYNTTMPMPANGMARRYNDAELVKAAANVEKLIDPFRQQLEASLTANTSVTPETRQMTLQQVDKLKGYAHALNQALGDNKEGVPEADALIKQALVVVDWLAKNTVSTGVSSAWAPLRLELGKVALSYEVNNKNLPVQ